ncbi:hypothetical protein BVRB_015100 [Beta vulgaris subsp. vulgaris]|uniref:Uncharacterized protein n=1 Tax=Beta vulgaris subsp. vulgaris TaxID=3555 RepID=A0A0J8B4P8_BETVV|nr:hypothetical protein BVRB_015100 [Beta vulgaris subsp. vulgaris]
MKATPPGQQLAGVLTLASSPLALALAALAALVTLALALALALVLALALDNADQEIQKIVRKLANAPQESGHLPNQNDAHNANNNNNGNGNGNGNGNVAFQPNAGGNINGNGNGGNNNGNGGGVSVVISNENPRIWMLIQRYNVNYRLVQRFHDFGLIPRNFESWETFANAVYQTWVDRTTNAAVYAPRPGSRFTITNAAVHAPRPGSRFTITNANANANANAEARVTTPANCWPGGMTVFGRIDNFGHFTALNWPDHEWETVRMLLNCVRIYEENAENGY